MNWAIVYLSVFGSLQAPLSIYRFPLASEFVILVLMTSLVSLQEINTNNINKIRNHHFNTHLFLYHEWMVYESWCSRKPLGVSRMVWVHYLAPCGLYWLDTVGTRTGLTLETSPYRQRFLYPASWNKDKRRLNSCFYLLQFHNCIFILKRHMNLNNNSQDLVSGNLCSDNFKELQLVTYFCQVKMFS